MRACCAASSALTMRIIYKTRATATGGLSGHSQLDDGSLGVMLVSSLWSVDSFTGDLVKKTSFANYHILFTQSVYRTVAIRTVGIAVGVTLIDLTLALPLAFFISKIVRSRRWRYALLIMVTMPLEFTLAVISSVTPEV